MNENEDNNKYYATYLPITKIHMLEHECKRIVSAFDMNIYHVGSSLKKPDFRDVDIRCILDDEEYDFFINGNKQRLELLNDAISLMLSEQTKLPIDFQFQRRTEANKEFKGTRNALGMIN